MTGLEAIAAGLGITFDPVAVGVYQSTFPTDLPVGRVISAFSADPAFLKGTPDWIDPQPWWW